MASTSNCTNNPWQGGKSIPRSFMCCAMLRNEVIRSRRTPAKLVYVYEMLVTFGWRRKWICDDNEVWLDVQLAEKLFHDIMNMQEKLLLHIKIHSTMKSSRREGMFIVGTSAAEKVFPEQTAAQPQHSPIQRTRTDCVKPDHVFRPIYLRTLRLGSFQIEADPLLAPQQTQLSIFPISLSPAIVNFHAQHAEFAHSTAHRDSICIYNFNSDIQFSKRGHELFINIFLSL